jgi:hypothetical protein
MTAQLGHLLEVSSLPNVDLRVIPYSAGALPSGNQFIILNFKLADVPDVVFIEGLTADLYLEDHQDVEAYNTTFRALHNLAESDEQALAIIAAARSEVAAHH